MSQYQRLTFLIIVVVLVQTIFGAKILFLFGGGNYSHKISIWPLVSSLSAKGHNVTYVSGSSRQPKPIPNVTDISPAFMNNITKHMYYVDMIQNRKDGKEAFFSRYHPATLHLCHLTLNSKEDPKLTDLIENGQFDLVVVDHIFGECGFYLAYHFGAKQVTFDSTFAFFYDMFGTQLETSWIPGFLYRGEYPMNFWARLESMYQSVDPFNMGQNFEESMRQIYMRRFGLNAAPCLAELKRNASVILVNSHYTVDMARSLPLLFIDVGGMALWEPEGVLPQNFKYFMNTFKDGVILISFGSTVEFNKLTHDYLFIFLSMMQKFSNVGFIWRWVGPIPGENSVRALITHGGMNNMQDATYHGVPVICMPLFADQDSQAYRIQAQEIGLKVEMGTLSQKSLDDAVFNILDDPKYKNNMMVRSRHFRDRPNPTETAVDAVEFVLRHNDFSAMKPMELNQSFWIRHHVDIYFFCFTILAVTNLLFPIGVFLICRKIFST